MGCKSSNLNTPRAGRIGGQIMALYLEELKQVFREQEQEQDKTAEELQRLKLEAIKARQELERERLKLNQEKAKAQQEAQMQRLELARAKEQRAKEQHEQRQQQAQKQQKGDNITYIASLLITFGSILASIILFVTILIKG